MLVKRTNGGTRPQGVNVYHVSAILLYGDISLWANFHDVGECNSERIM